MTKIGGGAVLIAAINCIAAKAQSQTVCGDPANKNCGGHCGGRYCRIAKHKRRMRFYGDLRGREPSGSRINTGEGAEKISLGEYPQNARRA